MTRGDIKNLPASVRARLSRIADQQHQTLDLTLTRYGLERFLYRLSKSTYSNNFLLKGALLFSLWYDVPHRPTRDADFLALQSIDLQHLADVFRSVCTIQVEPDGLDFKAETVRVHEIREHQSYQGIRANLLAMLGNARIPLQIDVGFGDAVTPAPNEIDFPTLLEFPAPHLSVYPKETVVAEKLEAMVQLGMANSRMKDFYDVRILALTSEFDGATLCEAIAATFARRRTTLPVQPPAALTEQFAKSLSKQTQWRAFQRKNGLDTDIALETVITDLSRFLNPPLKSSANGRSFNRLWTPVSGWHCSRSNK